MKTHKGSINMQNFMKRANPALIDKIIDEIQEDIAFLLTDNYGNYFCQKLVHNASGE